MLLNWPAIGASILPNVGGWGVAIMSRKNVKTWYKTLNRPAWTPPDWVYGPVWTVLYTSIGYASYLVWRDTGKSIMGTTAAAVPLGLYASQLLLNWAWTPIFFRAQSLKWSLVEISLLYVNAAACGVAFFQVNRIAGLIYIPYMIWLSIATSISYSIYANNPPKTIKG